MIYIAIFNILVFLRLALVRAARARRQIYILILLSVFLFSAFRFEVGCDWTGYINQYLLSRDLPVSEAIANREGLWVSLFALQGQFGLPYPWINVVSSLIFFVGLHAMARRQPDPLAFLVLLFPILVINMPMSGIRQGAAIGLMFFAFNAFVDRKTLRYVVFTLVATGLHSSALVFLLLAPLVNGSFSWKRLLIGGLLSLPGALIVLQGDAVEIASDRYVGTSIDAAGAVFRVGILGLSASYFLVFLQREWRRSFGFDFKLVMIGCLLMLSMLLLLPFSSVIADRLGYYFIPIQAVIFSRIPFFGFQRGRSVHVLFPYFVLGATFIVWASASTLFSQCYNPYQTWLFGFPAQVRWDF